MEENWRRAGTGAYDSTDPIGAEAGRSLGMRTGRRRRCDSGCGSKPTRTRSEGADARRLVTDSASHRAIDAIFRIESARLIAGLTRIVRDIGLAEDPAQDA